MSPPVAATRSPRRYVDGHIALSARDVHTRDRHANRIPQAESFASASPHEAHTRWVEDEVIVGHNPDHLRDAFTRAANDKPKTRLPTSLLWGAFTIALGVVGALALRTRSNVGTG